MKAENLCSSIKFGASGRRGVGVWGWGGEYFRSFHICLLFSSFIFFSDLAQTLLNIFVDAQHDGLRQAEEVCRNSLGRNIGFRQECDRDRRTFAEKTKQTLQDTWMETYGILQEKGSC